MTSTAVLIDPSRPAPIPSLSDGATRGVEPALEELAVRAGRGDSGAMESLTSRVRDLLVRWALVRTGDPDDAEDVAQEVLLKLPRALRSFDGRSRFTTWLYAVTRTTALDQRRSRKRRTGALERALREQSAAAAGGWTSPNPTLDRDRLARLVLTFFRELPPRQREVFDLAELQGRSSVEVAEALGIEAATVRVNLLKARRAIRGRILEAYPELVEDR